VIARLRSWWRREPVLVALGGEFVLLAITAVGGLAKAFHWVALDVAAGLGLIVAGIVIRANATPWPLKPEIAASVCRQDQQTTPASTDGAGVRAAVAIEHQARLASYKRRQGRHDV
jgi:hypothetical protein